MESTTKLTIDEIGEFMKDDLKVLIRDNELLTGIVDKN